MEKDGIPETAKLTSGERSPAIAPTYGPAKSPARMIGRCIGRKVSPRDVPNPDTAPIAWKSCGRATAPTIAVTTESDCTLTDSFGFSDTIDDMIVPPLTFLRIQIDRSYNSARPMLLILNTIIYVVSKKFNKIQ